MYLSTKNRHDFWGNQKNFNRGNLFPEFSIQWHKVGTTKAIGSISIARNSAVKFED